MTAIPKRLSRYKQFTDMEFADSLTWNKDYSLSGLDERLRQDIVSGRFKRIIFNGMGCSAIVSDAIKGFFADQKVPVYIDVINDSEIDLLIDTDTLKDESTLVIISSYSGHSKEPMYFYENVRRYTDTIIFLTSGGELAELAVKKGLSIIYWKLRAPDREYPLFHVPQYFSILLDIFFELKILQSNYGDELQSVRDSIKAEFTNEKLKLAEGIAARLRHRLIVFVASPKWYVSLLKLVDMHFNEMAMAPAHRNYFHEFTHSEIAVFSDPKQPMAIVMFREDGENDYRDERMDNLSRMMTDNRIDRNRNIEMVEIAMDKKNFIANMFSTLFFISKIAYFLGIHYRTESRELISTASGNHWYHQNTIQDELRKRDTIDREEY